MKKVGILVGREVTFPEAIINSINEKGAGKVTAEMVKIGGIRMDDEKKYDVIIDRISHEVPYFRATLKKMALDGTYIINNPFWWSADDKFFNFNLAAKIGVAIPKTVLLPQQEYIKDITSESLRNLEFPIDWAGIVNYVGFPAFLKPFDGGGWKNVSKVYSLEQLWYEYNQTGTLCMTLQEGIEFDQFVRCYCVGKEKVLIMPYDPSKPYLSGEQYHNAENYLSPELHARVEEDVKTICRALGYDLNTVEFAIKDGIPYAIDFMNPAPDAELASVGEANHRWIVDQMTDFILEKLETGFDKPEYRWDAMLNPMPAKTAEKKTEAKKTKSETASKTVKAKTAKTKTAKAKKASDNA
ncbi:MAG: ATP-grasp domain-containing protein [Pyrinomonadaceae bacterium]